MENTGEVRKVSIDPCSLLRTKLGAGLIFGLYKYIEPQLPDVATLKDVRLQIPMVFIAPTVSDSSTAKSAVSLWDVAAIPPSW
ncbi:hypothetical protein MJ561_27030 [Klebsiella pneumoniae]|nr:hypothetical protein MJ561_27030 [Klebsiella pneumoniae]